MAESIQSLSSVEAETVPDVDLRTSVRLGSLRARLVRFLVKPHFHCRRAILRDLSVHGIGLLLNHELSPDDVLYVQLLGMRPGTSCTRLARVIHATLLGPDQWLVGCEWTVPLTELDIRQTLRGED